MNDRKPCWSFPHASGGNPLLRHRKASVWLDSRQMRAGMTDCKAHRSQTEFGNKEKTAEIVEQRFRKKPGSTG